MREKGDTVPDRSPGLCKAHQAILAEIRRLTARLKRPILVALDRGSGAGKSTLAARIAQEIDVA